MPKELTDFTKSDTQTKQKEIIVNAAVYAVGTYAPDFAAAQLGTVVIPPPQPVRSRVLPRAIPGGGGTVASSDTLITDNLTLRLEDSYSVVAGGKCHATHQNGEFVDLAEIEHSLTKRAIATGEIIDPDCKILVLVTANVTEHNELVNSLHDTLKLYNHIFWVKRTDGVYLDPGLPLTSPTNLHPPIQTSTPVPTTAVGADLALILTKVVDTKVKEDARLLAGRQRRSFSQDVKEEYTQDLGNAKKYAEAAAARPCKPEKPCSSTPSSSFFAFFKPKPIEVIVHKHCQGEAEVHYHDHYDHHDYHHHHTCSSRW